MDDRHPDLPYPWPPVDAPFALGVALGVACPTCGCGPNIPCILKYGEPAEPHVERCRLASGRIGPPPSQCTQPGPGSPVCVQQDCPVHRSADDHIRPKHYGGPEDPYEPLKVMLAQHGKDAVVWFCWLTAEKYLARAGKKPGEPVERDLRKAAFYLTHAAELLEKP